MKEKLRKESKKRRKRHMEEEKGTGKRKGGDGMISRNMRNKREREKSRTRRK